MLTRAHLRYTWDYGGECTLIFVYCLSNSQVGYWAIDDNCMTLCISVVDLFPDLYPAFVPFIFLVSLWHLLELCIITVTKFCLLLSTMRPCMNDIRLYLVTIFHSAIGSITCFGHPFQSRNYMKADTCNGSGNENGKTRREPFEFWDLVRFILEFLRCMQNLARRMWNNSLSLKNHMGNQLRPHQPVRKIFSCQFECNRDYLTRNSIPK